MAEQAVEELREMYIDDRMSPKEISDELGVHFSTIYRRLDRHGIERESRVRFNTVGDGYEEARDPSDDRVYIHRLLAVAEYGFDAVVDSDIHHSNGVSWDNRPSNIEPIDHADHTKRHKSGLTQPRDESGRFA